MQQPMVIDTKMHGYDGITATFLLRGGKTALVETGPKSSVANVIAGLDAAGVQDLDWIVVTHIHLDHAGAAGTLARRFPKARIAVHPVGAPHLVDPSKLWSSATRIYGDAMDELWGGIDPIDEDRIEIVEDADAIDLGGRSLKAIETPGHAGHHHAYLDDATGLVFTGDALGVRPQGIAAIRPATPPPEFNLEVAVESIEKLRRLAPKELWFTHFGRSDLPVDQACTAATDALRRWGTWVEEARARTADVEQVTAAVVAKDRAELGSALSEEDATRMEHTTSYRMNVSGYMRYFDKMQR